MIKPKKIILLLAFIFFFMGLISAQVQVGSSNPTGVIISYPPTSGTSSSTITTLINETNPWTNDSTSIFTKTNFPLNITIPNDNRIKFRVATSIWSSALNTLDLIANTISLRSNNINLGTGTANDIFLNFDTSKNDTIMSWTGATNYWQWTNDFLFSSGTKIFLNDVGKWITYNGTEGTLEVVANAPMMIKTTYLNSTGNVTAPYFVGNGSRLTSVCLTDGTGCQPATASQNLTNVFMLNESETVIGNNTFTGNVNITGTSFTKDINVTGNLAVIGKEFRLMFNNTDEFGSGGIFRILSASHRTIDFYVGNFQFMGYNSISEVFTMGQGTTGAMNIGGRLIVTEGNGYAGTGNTGLDIQMNNVSVEAIKIVNAPTGTVNANISGTGNAIFQNVTIPSKSKTCYNLPCTSYITHNGTDLIIQA
jgi:hypothetical protein